MQERDAALLRAQEQLAAKEASTEQTKLDGQKTIDELKKVIQATELEVTIRVLACDVGQYYPSNQ